MLVNFILFYIDNNCAHLHLGHIISKSFRISHRILKKPPTKIELGDVHNEEHVKENDSAGKWIERNVCHQVIRVSATFSFTEWLNHYAHLQNIVKR